ncbi:MAG TPA: redox-sensing transcriptional repressor Rex [bacterium]|nr:redox-sensing transcriptional repressor Rex [Candidatus Omnitrophota bacterium]HOL93959.1 redox-sensing transcriptional repressor Rex [bacterium]HXK93348.1 redox-sensing transcriptional repressor Rex [bacterium]
MDENIKSKPPQLSEATLFRMSRYLNVLEEFSQKGIQYISTSKLAFLLGVNPAVVKQDFLPLKVKGQTGVGYEVPQLLQTIREVFLSRRTLTFAIVGFGNIGQALASYQGFERDGFKVGGIFDSNPKFQNYSVRGVKIEDVENLTRICRERQIDIGVICTPASVAQEVADQLVLGGVKGIWNFAPTELIVPEHVILVHEHLTRGLLTISYHISQRYGVDQIPEDVDQNPVLTSPPESAETQSSTAE